eukprot:4480305-Amphidinium_carterae.1
MPSTPDVDWSMTWGDSCLWRLEYPATDALNNPSLLPSATHGMRNATMWSLVFKYPDTVRTQVQSFTSCRKHGGFSELLQ